MSLTAKQRTALIMAWERKHLSAKRETEKHNKRLAGRLKRVAVLNRPAMEVIRQQDGPRTSFSEELRMGRAGKTSRVPKTRAGGEWTDAAFFAFLRSGLRQMSRRWPPLVRQALHRARRSHDGTNKRQKWEYQCSACQLWHMAKKVEVDHVEPCGSLRSMADVTGFVERLFCEPEKLRVLCEGCHAMRTANSAVLLASRKKQKTISTGIAMPGDSP